MTGSREWTPAEGAPGRAARSPAIAAVLILFAQKQERRANCRKNRMAFRRRETAGKPGQKTKAITDPGGRFVKILLSDRRAGVEARRER
jgi:hypothetical protein